MRRTEWRQEIRMTRFEEAFVVWTESRLTQASKRCAPVDEVLALVERYQTGHPGWDVRHFHTWYRRDGSGRSVHNRTDDVLQNRTVLFAINIHISKNYLVSVTVSRRAFKGKDHSSSRKVFVPQRARRTFPENGPAIHRPAQWGWSTIDRCTRRQTDRSH